MEVSPLVNAALDEGSAAFKAGDLARAIALFRQAAATDPEDHRPLHNLGAALRRAGELEEAEAILLRAVELAGPEAMPSHALGNHYRYVGRLEEAEAACRRAIGFDPGFRPAKLTLGHVRLARGDYPEGFRLYEHRKFVPGEGAAAPPFREWAGEPLEGRRILVWPEQGAGDQIMGARFVAELQAQGASVEVVATARLGRLFAAGAGLRVAPLGGAISALPDVAALHLSLPTWLGVTVESVPPPLALDVPALKGPGRIGVVPQGSAQHVNDANRSMTDEAARALLALPGAVDLRPESTGARDYYETAAVIAGLDAVVTVDTSVAHLAASLGKPTFVLLPALGQDWRWLAGRTDSPWYPSLRLYRQSTPGDWLSLIEAVRREL